MPLPSPLKPLFEKTGDVLAIIIDPEVRAEITKILEGIGIQAQVEPTAHPNNKYIFAPGPIARSGYQTVVTDKSTQEWTGLIAEICEKEGLQIPKLILLRNDNNSAAAEQAKNIKDTTIIDITKIDLREALLAALGQTLAAA